MVPPPACLGKSINMIAWILLFGFSLRLINLQQSLWLDEGIQAWAVSHFSLKELLTQFMPTDVHPPLAYLVNFFSSQLIGYSEIALRTPSVIFSLLTIWFIYQLSQQLLPKPITFLPAWLLATSGLHIYYSQEARMYSLAVMAVTGSIWALIKFINTKKALNKALFSYFIFTLIAVYSHYSAWLILPAQLLMVYLLKPKKINQLVVSQFLILLAYLPWLPIFYQQLTGGIKAALSNQQWAGVVGGLSFKSLSLIPIKFLIGRISIDNNLIFALVMLLPLALITYLFLSLIKLININRHSQKSSLALKIILPWLIIPVILTIIISFKIPILSYTRLLFILPAFYLALSLAISSLASPWRSLAVISLLLINLISSPIYLFNQKFHRENWQGLSRVLIEKNTNNQPVAIISTVQAPLQYYYPPNITNNISDNNPTNIIDFSQLASSADYNELWLIPYAQPIFYPDLNYHQTLTSIGFQERFKQHFRGGLTLVKYTK